ncbi:MAG: DUF4124 domain-containing protein [Deltaproteobacteria bacterium]|nr:DUF4124 domain-containing protein [Deltaproteobacteria bacterium]
MRLIFMKFCAILLCLFPATAPAQDYKWVDENGVIHFSDRPRPQSSKDFKAINIEIEKDEKLSSRKLEVNIEALRGLKNADLDPKLFLEEFREVIPKPEWWEQVSYPGDGVHSEGEVLSYWQSKKRCCVDKEILTRNNREFFKAAYEGIEKYPGKDHLVTKALWLMTSIADEREVRVNLRKLLLNHFFYHGQSLDRCANCEPANTIVRCTRDLARDYYADGDKEKAITLLEFVLDEREKETSLWVLTETYTFLADLYFKTSVNKERVERLKNALKKLEAYKDIDQNNKRFPKFDLSYQRVIKMFENNK